MIFNFFFFLFLPLRSKIKIVETAYFYPSEHRCTRFVNVTLLQYFYHFILILILTFYSYLISPCDFLYFLHPFYSIIHILSFLIFYIFLFFFIFFIRICCSRCIAMHGTHSLLLVIDCIIKINNICIIYYCLREKRGRDRGKEGEERG